MGPRTGYTSRMEQILYLDFSTTPPTTFIAGERLVIRYCGRAVISARVEFDGDIVKLCDVQTPTGPLPLAVVLRNVAAVPREATIDVATGQLLDAAASVAHTLSNTPTEWDKQDMRQILRAVPTTATDPAEMNAIFMLRKFAGEFEDY